MFLQSHYLQGIISELRHLRQDILTEFLECTDFLLLCCHSYMALIYQRVLTSARLRILPLIRTDRVPYLRTELLCHRILHCSCHIRRKSFRSAAFPLDV